MSFNLESNDPYIKCKCTNGSNMMSNSSNMGGNYMGSSDIRGNVKPNINFFNLKFKSNMEDKNCQCFYTPKLGNALNGNIPNTSSFYKFNKNNSIKANYVNYYLTEDSQSNKIDIDIFKKLPLMIMKDQVCGNNKGEYKDKYKDEYKNEYKDEYKETSFGDGRGSDGGNLEDGVSDGKGEGSDGDNDDTKNFSINWDINSSNNQINVHKIMCKKADGSDFIVKGSRSFIPAYKFNVNDKVHGNDRLLDPNTCTDVLNECGNDGPKYKSFYIPRGGWINNQFEDNNKKIKENNQLENKDIIFNMGTIVNDQIKVNTEVKEIKEDGTAVNKIKDLYIPNKYTNINDTSDKNLDENWTKLKDLCIPDIG